MFSNGEVMKCVPRIEIIDHDAIVTEWGMIDDIVFHVGDKLLIGKPEPGYLLILKPYGMGHYKFGRLVNNQIILEPHGQSVTKSCWEITGIKGIEKPISSSSLGKENWFITVGNLNNNLDLSWLESIKNKPINSMYLNELGAQLHKIDPNISIFARKYNDQLSTCVPRPGKIVFSISRRESNLTYVDKWALGYRREKRRKWDHQRSIEHSVKIISIPNMQPYQEYGRLASK